MKTTKVIDLLVDIANGKIETFYKFKYRNKIVTMDYLLDNYLFLEILNDEVEIIEDTPKEDKKIEKLDLQYKDISKGIKFEDQILMYCDNLQYKINEIIDYINEGDE